MQKKIFVIFILIIVSLTILIIVFIFRSSSSYKIEYSQRQENSEVELNGKLFVSDYFNKDLPIDKEMAENDPSEYCLLGEDLVKEGTAKSDTVCVRDSITPQSTR